MYGSVLEFIRVPLTNRYPFVRKLLTCSLCTGFWVGVTIGCIAYIWTKDNSTLFLPLVSASICWLYDNIIGVLQSIEIKNKK